MTRTTVKLVDEAIFDVLRQEFCRVPGMLDALVDNRTYLTGRSPASLLRVFFLLAECKPIAGELLAFPGVVDMFLRIAKLLHAPLLQSLLAFERLMRLVRVDVMQALGNAELVAGLLALVDDNTNATRYREHAHKCLSRLLLVVHQRGDREFKLQETVENVSRFHAQTEAEKKQVLVFWRNVPGVWAVISTRRLMQRSPLRRLPIEMFRLLKDML